MHVNYIVCGGVCADVPDRSQGRRLRELNHSVEQQLRENRAQSQ